MARSRNQFCPGTAISITYPECVFVALVIQQTKRMHHNILSSVACLTLPYFSRLFHKLHDFRDKKKVIEHKLCVWIFCANFVRNISNSEKYSARYYHKCTLVFMSSTGYSCQILIKTRTFSTYLLTFRNLASHI